MYERLKEYHTVSHVIHSEIEIKKKVFVKFYILT